MVHLDFLFMRFSSCSRQFGTFPFRDPGMTTPTFWPLFAYVPVVKLPGRAPQIIGRSAPALPAVPIVPTAPSAPKAARGAQHVSDTIEMENDTEHGNNNERQ